MRLIAPTVFIAISLGLAGCDRTESDWQSAQQTNTPAAYNEFLAKHAQGAHVDEARKAIETLAWKGAQTKNVSESYQQYLGTYPAGQYVTEAKAAIEELAWTSAKSANTEDALNQYLLVYPQGAHSGEAKEKSDILAKARQLALEEQKKQEARAGALKGSSIATAMEYLKRYPGDAQESQLREHIAELRRAKLTGNWESGTYSYNNASRSPIIVWKISLMFNKSDSDPKNMKVDALVYLTDFGNETKVNTAVTILGLGCEAAEDGAALKKVADTFAVTNSAGIQGYLYIDPPQELLGTGEILHLTILDDKMLVRMGEHQIPLEPKAAPKK
jgi:hypothetical protein